MAAERYLSRRIPDLRVGNNIDEIDKKLIPASIHPCFVLLSCRLKINFLILSYLSCASIPVYLGNLCQTDTEKIEGGNRAVNLHNFNHMSEAV